VTNNGTNDWWLLDDTCTKAFALLQDEMDNAENVQDDSTTGFWTCPKVSGNSWATQTREVVSLKLVNDWNRPDNWKTADNALKGSIYHFGHSDRKIQVGLSDTMQVTGACCDIGWYLVPDDGALYEMMIYMSAMVPSGGLTFAIQYPADTVFTIKRCIDGCTYVTLAADKATFLASEDGLTYYVEDSTLFLKLVHPSNDYYQPYGAGKLLKNTYHTSVDSYKIRSSLTGSVKFALPAANWLSG